MTPLSHSWLCFFCFFCREQERQQLQDLVGKNLTYLSQLDGLDYDLYSNKVRGGARFAGVGGRGRCKVQEKCDEERERFVCVCVREPVYQPSTSKHQPGLFTIPPLPPPLSLPLYLAFSASSSSPSSPGAPPDD